MCTWCGAQEQVGDRIIEGVQVLLEQGRQRWDIGVMNRASTWCGEEGRPGPQCPLLPMPTTTTLIQGSTP
jgi:hypothetical protein